MSPPSDSTTPGVGERILQRLGSLLGLGDDPPGMLGTLGMASPRHRSRELVELVSASSDTDFLGFGSSPHIGEYAQTGIAIPAAATLSQSTRYLFRHFKYEVIGGRAAIIRGFRTLTTIRAEHLATKDGPVDYVIEREIVSPLWHFIDGNITYHVRREPTRFAAPRSDPAQLPGTSPNNIGFDSALLYIPVPAFAPYLPPSAGKPPGEAVAHLGTIREQRFAWTNTDWSMHQVVRGPCVIGVYSSCWQTSLNRTAMPELPLPVNVTLPDTTGLRPEDAFLREFEAANAWQVRYGRTAAAMLLEVLPEEEMFR